MCQGPLELRGSVYFSTAHQPHLVMCVELKATVLVSMQATLFEKAGQREFFFQNTRSGDSTYYAVAGK